MRPVHAAAGQGKIYPIFVADSLASKKKEYTSLGRFNIKITNMNMCIRAYMGFLQQGDAARAAQCLGDLPHLDECQVGECPPSCSFDRETKSSSQSSESISPFPTYIGSPVLWDAISHHLNTRAQEHPNKLALIGSFFEADDLLALLSLAFSVPILTYVRPGPPQSCQCQPARPPLTLAFPSRFPTGRPTRWPPPVAIPTPSSRA